MMKKWRLKTKKQPTITMYILTIVIISNKSAKEDDLGLTLIEKITMSSKIMKATIETQERTTKMKVRKVSKR